MATRDLSRPAPRGLAPAAERQVGRIVGGLARGLAMLGGLALSALVLMTIASILGRSLIGFGLRPIPGDFELVEMGCAFAVFAFLPWCQYRRGHVTVDLLVQPLGRRWLAGAALIGNLVMTLAAGLLAWQLGLGLEDKLRYQETTFILLMPVWWGYAAGLLGAGLFVLVAAFTVWRSLNELLQDGEPEHAADEAGG